MSFLIDENLSRRLIHLFEPAFPGFRHVAEFGLLAAKDDVIHSRAVVEKGTLLSKDDDFRVRINRVGPPPKLVFVRLGNLPTQAIADATIVRRAEIEAFLVTPLVGVLEISRA